MNIHTALGKMDLHQLNALLDKQSKVQFPTNGFCQPRINWEKHGYSGSVKLGDLGKAFKFFEKSLNKQHLLSTGADDIVLFNKITNILHGVKQVISIQNKVDLLWRNHSYSNKLEAFAAKFPRTHLLGRNIVDKNLNTLVDKLIVALEKIEDEKLSSEKKELLYEFELIKANSCSNTIFGKLANFGSRTYNFAEKNIVIPTAIKSPALKMANKTIELVSSSFSFLFKYSSIPSRWNQEERIKQEKAQKKAAREAAKAAAGIRGKAGPGYTRCKSTYTSRTGETYYEYSYIFQDFSNDPRFSYSFRDKPKPEISPYAAMGLNKDASTCEIKKKYHKLALRYHPDKNTDPKAKGIFQKINNAYEIISDKKKRREYDMSH